MIEITADSVRAGLTALVEEAGSDFVYSKRVTDPEIGERCTYVHNGQPDCIVGRFLAAEGVPLVRLERADDFGGKPADMLLNALIGEGVVQAPHIVREALQTAQSAQDNGHKWGDALTGALNELDRYNKKLRSLDEI